MKNPNIKKTPVTLLIMDGFGLAQPGPGNAIHLANTPELDALIEKHPHTALSASGKDAGLPEGTMGNSEVGHTNIGAGRVVYQNLLRISNAIDDGSFYDNPVYIEAADACAASGASAHILGLLSDVGVHSHTDHLWALLKLLKARGLTRVYLHCFMDGRDSSPTSGAGYMRETVRQCAQLGIGKVASICGRFYGMDRDQRWDRVKRAYDAMVLGEARYDPDPVNAVEESYTAGKTDEFIEPVVCDKEGLISPGDTVFFINFRPDRAREITSAFTDPLFDGFNRAKGYFPLSFICAAQYDADIPNVRIAFPPEFPKNTFGEYLSKLGMTQLRIAETEKYAHVTFFFNGGIEAPFPGEDRILIPSSKEYPTYDLIPQMKALEITEKVCQKISEGLYDVVVVNLANCDMVGHTGVMKAAITAVETVDSCVGRIVRATAQEGGITIVTSDHGNAEDMTDPNKSPHTAHSTNPVPFIICGADAALRSGRICDIVPTILEMMGLEKPPEMTGISLIVK